jgi:hypothetical protein
MRSNSYSWSQLEGNQVDQGAAMHASILALAAAAGLASAHAAAETSQWYAAGTTSADCAFTAELKVLSGYPFARLDLTTPEGVRTIPLVVVEGGGCTSVTYHDVRTPTSTPPTVEATGRYLCQGRLPRYDVVVSWSGVQHACVIE